MVDHQSLISDSTEESLKGWCRDNGGKLEERTNEYTCYMNTGTWIKVTDTSQGSVVSWNGKQEHSGDQEFSGLIRHSQFGEDALRLTKDEGKFGTEFESRDGKVRKKTYTKVR